MDKVKCPCSFPKWNYSLATVSLPLTLLDSGQQLGMFSHRFQNQVCAFSKDPLPVKESMVEVKPKHWCNHTHLQHICITQQPGQLHAASLHVPKPLQLSYTALKKEQKAHMS